MAIFLDEAQVTELLDMESCIRVLEDAFKDKAEGEASVLPRRRLPFRGARFMIMASTMSRKGWYGFKVYGEWAMDMKWSCTGPAKASSRS